MQHDDDNRPRRAPRGAAWLAAALLALPAGVARAEPPPALPPAAAPAPKEAPAEKAPADKPPADKAPADKAPAEAAADPEESATAVDLRTGGLRGPLLPPPRYADDAPRRGLMFITGGITVVGVGLGAVFGVLAVSRWNGVEDAVQTQCLDPGGYRGCTQQVKDLQVEASSFATISTFCFLTGTLAFGGTALLWLRGPPARDPRFTRIEVLPAIGSTGAGGLVRGTF